MKTIEIIFIIGGAKNYFERLIEDLLLDQLGEFTSIKDLAKLLKTSKTAWYNFLDEGRIIEFNLAKRRVVVTRSLLPFLRESMGVTWWD